MLHLVSRVQDKRGDIRLLLRQDPTVQPEVHRYLDDLTWLSQQGPISTNPDRAAANKARLLSTVRGQETRKRKVSLMRVAGMTASFTALFTLIGSAQFATHNLPQPVDQMLTGFLFASESGTTAPSRTTGNNDDVSFPVTSAEPAGSGFTN